MKEFLKNGRVGDSNLRERIYVWFFGRNKIVQTSIVWAFSTLAALLVACSVYYLLTNSLPDAIAYTVILTMALVGFPTLYVLLVNIEQLERTNDRNIDLEEEISHTRDSLALALDPLGEGIAIYDADDRLVVFNESFKRISGPIGERLRVGMTFREHLKEITDLTSSVGMLEHLLLVLPAETRIKIERGETDSVDAWTKWRSDLHESGNHTTDMKVGEDAWLRMSEQRTKSGGISLVCTDISEYKSLMSALEESQTDYAYAIDSLHGLFWTWDAASAKLTTHPNRFTSNDMLGVASDGVSEEFVDLIHPDDRARHLATFKKHLAGETEVYECEYRIRQRNGDYVWVHDRGVSRRDNSGCVTRVVGTVISTNDVKQAEQKLKESRLDYQMAVQATSGIVWTWNGSTGLIHADTARLAEFGPRLSPGGFQLEDWISVIHEDDRERYQQKLVSFLKGDIEKLEIRYRAVDKHGRTIWLDDGALCLRDDRNTVLRMIGCIIDITEKKHTEDELVKAKEKAEHANAAKSQFLAAMSHEIRTPMNGVLGMAQILMSSDLPARQQKLARTIIESGKSLLAIINDILDYSKIEARKLELEQVDFKPGEVIEQVVHLYTESANTKNISLLCDLDEALYRTFIGDPGRFQQILSNLLNNAVKFTESGTITIEAQSGSSEFGDPDNRQIHISMTDTGCGLAEKNLNVIFDAFAQADQSTTRQFGGTGLGLSIVKQLIEKMGGQITVDSTVGKGTRFDFNIVLACKAFETDIPVSATWKIDLAVIDGHDVNRNHVENLLCNRVNQLTCFENIEHAARKIGADCDPAVIILSAYDNVEAQLECLFNQVLSRYTDLPRVILLTRETGKLDALPNWVAQALAIPFTRSELIDAINGLFRDPIENISASEQVPDLGALESARILVVEDNVVNQEVARESLERIKCDVEIAENGAEALLALESENFDAILMDCSMPVMDGYEATRIIRDRGIAAIGGGAIPIVALTAHALKGDTFKCVRAGMNDRLSKPFSLEELYLTLSVYINKKKQAQEQETVTSDDVGSETPLDLTGLQSLLSGKEDGGVAFMEKLFRIYLQTTPNTISSLTEGEREGDFEKIGTHAHALASPSANIGAVKLAELCKKMRHAVEQEETDQVRFLKDEIVTEYENVTTFVENKISAITG